MKIKKKTVNYFLKAYKDKNQRFLSWNHCYNYFSSGKANKDIETACLHLAFYLASWGMYRGSSWLLSKDYLIHKNVVKEITKNCYKPLINASIETYLKDSKNIDLLFQLSNNISNIYYKDVPNKKPSDILITKILLGTLACVPAYDRYFKHGLKKYKLPQSYSKKSFLELMLFCEENKCGLNDFKRQIKKNDYPEMKVIDMYFWCEGL